MTPIMIPIITQKVGIIIIADIIEDIAHVSPCGIDKIEQCIFKYKLNIELQNAYNIFNRKKLYELDPTPIPNGIYDSPIKNPIIPPICQPFRSFKKYLNFFTHHPSLFIISILSKSDTIELPA